MEPEFHLLTQYLSGNISDEELHALDEWRNLSEENEQLFSEVTKLRLLKEYEQRDTVLETLTGLRRFQSNTQPKRNSWRLREALKYAAIAALLITASVFTWMYFTSEKYTTIAVEESESVKKVLLADGSAVWLSGGSELRIPESFSSDKRRLSFTGQAFFDIKKNPKSPFVITGNYVNVKVTGTSFSLKTDAEGKSMEAILSSGKIVLQNHQKQDIYTMSPGEKVVYDSDNNRYTVRNVDTNTLTAWHLDQITFENATLREIVNKLSLIYDVNINLQSKKIADKHFRCVINREESLKEVLDILTYLTPLKYKIEGNEVFITE